MNTLDRSGNGSAATDALPELSDERVDEIENAVFARIAQDREAHTARRAKRGRIWLAAGAAAAVIVVAAVIAPGVANIVRGGVVATSSGADSAPAPDAPVEMTDSGGAESGAADGADLAAPDLVAPGLVEQSTGEREIITSASASIEVDDVAAAARQVGNAAVAREGYVESMNVGTSGGVAPYDGAEPGIAYDTMPYPYPPDGAWVSVRVPSAELPAMIDELADIGEVTSSSINRQDVTEQAVDLRARIDAAEASVARLTELMGQATSVADLLTAESALSERQAQLESYQQQLQSLEGMVELSSLTVSLTPVFEPVEADPAGFGDGLAAGWNGLVATLNGIVVALGFLLPWLVVIAIAGVIVWLIVRAARRRRAARSAAELEQWSAARPQAGVGADAAATPPSSTEET